MSNLDYTKPLTLRAKGAVTILFGALVCFVIAGSGDMSGASLGALFNVVVIPLICLFVCMIYILLTKFIRSKRFIYTACIICILFFLWLGFEGRWQTVGYPDWYKFLFH